MYSFDDNMGTEYHEKCGNCGALITVKTQDDNAPEYHTCVHVWCQICGDGAAEFYLPVN